MEWKPALDEDEEREMKTGWLSDNTAFMRMQVQLEKNDIIDKDFYERFAPRIIQLDKFAALSNADKQQKQIERIRTIKMDFLEDAGLYDEAIKSSLDSVRDHQNLRGYKGFFQKAIITERHEIKQDKQAAAKMSRFSGLFGRKQKEIDAEEEE